MSKITLTFKSDPSAGDLPAEVHFDSETSSAPRPIVLIFHAGGFAAGSSAMVSPAEIEVLVRMGFVVVVPAYRLVPQVALREGPIADAQDSLTWARKELPALLEKEGVRADPAKVFAMGHSAGGSLALWLGSLPEPPTAILAFYGCIYFRDPFWRTPLSIFAGMPTPDPEVCARIFDGPVPLASPPMFVDGKPDLVRPRAAWMIGGLKSGSWLTDVVRGPAKEVGEATWADVEPTKGFGPGYPPTCFIQGDSDPFVPLELTKKAHAALVAQGVQSDLLEVKGGNHLLDMAMSEEDPVFQSHIMKGLHFLKAHA